MLGFKTQGLSCQQRPSKQLCH